MKLTGPLIAFIFSFSLLSLAQAVGLEVESSVLGDTAHLEFLGRDQWVYDIQKTAKGKQTLVQIKVSELSDKAVNQLKKFRGGPVASVVVEPAESGMSLVKVLLEASDVESFDYLTDQPSRLIVDLYPKKKTVVKKTSPAKENNPEKGPGQIADAKKSKNSRKPATADVLVLKDQTMDQLKELEGPGNSQAGIFDGADPLFSRFNIQDYEVREDAVLQARQKDYLDFPILHERLDELEKLKVKKAYLRN